MSNRIVLFSEDGTALLGIDCHHGSAMAARWVEQATAQLAAQGVEAVVLEIEPEQGGDEARTGIVRSLHRLRAETRRRPDGRRELLGLLRLGDDDDPRTASAATPERVRGGLRLVHAPGTWAGDRRELRRARSRLDDTAGAPTVELQRQQRRALRAAGR